MVLHDLGIVQSICFFSLGICVHDWYVVIFHVGFNLVLSGYDVTL